MNEITLEIDKILTIELLPFVHGLVLDKISYEILDEINKLWDGINDEVQNPYNQITNQL